MALKVEKGIIASPGATGNQTINLIDTGFGQVKALIVWTAYQTAEADTDASAIWSHGFGTYRGSVAQQWQINHYAQDAAGTSAVAGGSSDSSILRGLNSGAAALDFDVALVSLGDAQFVLNWTDLPTSASIKVHYLALGGADITDALVKRYDLTAGTGLESFTVETDFGQPDLLIAAGSGTVGEGVDRSYGTPIMFGVGKDDTNQAVSTYANEDGRPSMELAAFQEADFIAMFGNDTAMDVNAVLAARSGWPTNGFRIDKLTNYASNQAMVGVLALKGSFTSVIGRTTVPTDAPTVTQDLAVGATPRGAIFFHNALPATAGMDNTHADLNTSGLGAMDGTREGWAAVGDNDGAASSETRRHHSESKAIKMFTPGAAGTLQSEADASFSGNNVRLTWADTDTVAREFCYLLLGDAPALGTTYEKTGVLTSAVSQTGLDAEEKVEVGLMVSGCLVLGSDANERAEFGAVASGSFLAGADVAERSELGSIFSSSLLSGISEKQIGGKEGSLFASARILGFDSIERGEIGILLAGSRLGAIDAADRNETGSIRASVLAAGMDVQEAAVSGLLSASGRQVGFDAAEHLETAYVASQGLLAGLDNAEKVEAGVLLAGGRVFGIGIKEGPGKYGSLVAGSRLAGVDAAEFLERGSLLASTFGSGLKSRIVSKEGLVFAGGQVYGVDAFIATETGLLISVGQLNAIKSSEFTKFGSVVSTIELFGPNEILSGYMMVGDEIHVLTNASVERGRITAADAGETIIVATLPGTTRITKSKVE